MYGGLGLALVTSSALMLKLGHGRVGFAFSTEGLRAAVPIIAFWTVAGLRAAFLGPADRRVNWLFRVIHGKPGWDESTATRIWVLIWALALTLGSVALTHAVAPPALRGWRSLGLQLFAGASLCLLLTDAFFLNVKTVPFTGTRSAASMNLAYVLIQYFGLFPPLVLHRAQPRRLDCRKPDTPVDRGRRGCCGARGTAQASPEDTEGFNQPARRR